LLDDATEVLYCRENTEFNALVELGLTHSEIVKAANWFPFNVFGKYTQQYGGGRKILEQAAKSLVLFVQHEFLRAGEQGKVLNDRVVRAFFTTALAATPERQRLY
jgi:hypothetical protein